MLMHRSKRSLRAFRASQAYARPSSMSIMTPRLSASPSPLRRGTVQHHSPMGDNDCSKEVFLTGKELVQGLLETFGAHAIGQVVQLPGSF